MRVLKAKVFAETALFTASEALLMPRNLLRSCPPPKRATVDDIPSWERLAPNAAVSYARDREQREARLAEAAAGEWLAAWQEGDLDAKDEEGWSALQRAAEAGQSVAVAQLLRRPGVEVNGVEPTEGQPALVLASRGGRWRWRSCCGGQASR